MENERLRWDSKEHPPFIMVYQSIGGWKPQLCVWVKRPGAPGYYDVWNTGFGHNDKAKAIAEAKEWAKDEGYEYRA